VTGEGVGGASEWRLKKKNIYIYIRVKDGVSESEDGK
jgi:hypothetical protein